MSPELERALAFVTAMQDRMATRSVPFFAGTALFHDELRRVYYLNFLRVERAGDLTLERLVAEAERLHAEAGHEHAKVEVNDERGRGLEDGFGRLGWRVERDVVMVHRGELAHARAADAVTEVDGAALRPVWAQGIRSSPGVSDEEAVEQLVAAQLLRERATSVRYFAARADGRLVSECSLFSDGRTAQVESVQTLPEYRNRGLARATVARAVAEARAGGHELVFLFADDGDWPKELYRKLGFEPAGFVWEFVRAPTSARPEGTPPAGPGA